jgi:hypothetical protein
VARGPTTSACTCSTPTCRSRQSPFRLASARPSSSAPTSSRYVGVYQLEIGLSLDVTLDGGVLSIQPAGQAKLRLWPETETDFFVKPIDVQFTFVRDARGTVTGVVLHQAGQNIPGDKVK